MKTKFVLFFLVFTVLIACNNSESKYIQEIEAAQHELNEFYFNPETSPLKKDELVAFKAQGGHAFYPINTAFKVHAKLTKHANPDTVLMPTSSDVIKAFLKSYRAEFSLNGKQYVLSLFQNVKMMNDPSHPPYLFLPFRDMTSGKETYGGGRYIDLEMPQGLEITIDFNKAYHPYCAYTKGYSCPVPPEENYLALPVEAGIKLHEVKQAKHVIHPLPMAQPIFDSFNVEGSFIWYDLKRDSLFAYGDSLIYKRQSPASTFKVLNSLIMLQEGIIQDTFQEIEWDGIERSWNKWNQNQTLPTAIRYSALWAYQEMARRLNEKSDTIYPFYLKSLRFGNQSIDKADAFWVDNSLAISPIEQLTFLKKLYHEDLPFDLNHIRTVKEIIKVKKLGKYQMSGKTGWGIKNDKNTGWYIGYVTQNDQVYFYVTTVSPKSELQPNEHFRRMYVGTTESMIQKLLNL